MGYHKKLLTITSIIDKESVYYGAFFFFFTFVYYKIELKSVSLRFAKNMQHTEETIEIIGARAHNLKNIDVSNSTRKTSGYYRFVGFWKIVIGI